MITYNYGPRQIGKTTTIINKYNKDDLIITNNGMVDRIKDKLNSFYTGPVKKLPKHNVISNHCDLRNLNGRNFNIVYLDDFDFFKNKNQIIERISHRCESIEIYTTLSWLRPMHLSRLIQSIPWNMIDRDKLDLFNNYNDTKDLINKLIIDPFLDNNVKKVKLDIPKWRKTFHKDMFHPYQYKLEVLGEAFYDESKINECE